MDNSYNDREENLESDEVTPRRQTESSLEKYKRLLRETEGTNTPPHGPSKTEPQRTTPNNGEPTVRTEPVDGRNQRGVLPRPPLKQSAAPSQQQREGNTSTADHKENKQQNEKVTQRYPSSVAAIDTNTVPDVLSKKNKKSDMLKKNFKDKVVSNEIQALLDGDWRTYAHLDPVIEKVKDHVQKVLVDEGHSQKIVKARNDKATKKELIDTIQHLTFEKLYEENINEKSTRKYVLQNVCDEILGLGPIEVLWNDESITEVMCNGPEDIWIEQYGQVKKVTGVRFRNANHLLKVCEKILLPLNRKLDIKSPLADGRLPDGSRVNAVHTRIAPFGPNLTIRKFPAVNFTMKDLVDLGSLTEEMACTIAWLIRNKATMLVSGGTGSGKLLPLNTRIPTPEGWTTMGNLQVGDSVFGRDGQPCTVTAVSAVDPAPVLYEVEFSDGQKIVADEHHQWIVCDGHNTDSELTTGNTSHHHRTTTGSGEKVLTTGAIISECGGLSNYKTLHAAQRGRFAIRMTAPLDLPNIELSEGERWESFSCSEGEKAYVSKILRGSREQRIQLLKQMIVTNPNGFPAATQTSLAVPVVSTYVDTFVELIQSLGMKVVSPQRVTREGSPHFTQVKKETETGKIPGTVTVEFVTTPDINSVIQSSYAGNDVTAPFLNNDDWLNIVNIRPVASEPGQCIQVDSADSAYLIEGFIPTHNTTMLNALSAAIPKDERLLTIEDSLELRLDPQAHVVPQEAQPADSSGENSVTIRELVKNSLRMRPNRIIVGEVRDQAALEMLQVCNTGHEGSMSTIHANGPNEAISRLAVMIAQGGEFPADKVNWLVGSSIDIIVTVKRDRTGPRRVDGIYEVPEVEENETLKTIPLWEWKRTGTDENTGDPVGFYEQKNEISGKLREKLELDWNPKPTWEEVVHNFRD